MPVSQGSMTVDVLSRYLIGSLIACKLYSRIATVPEKYSVLIDIFFAMLGIACLVVLCRRTSATAEQPKSCFVCR